MKVREKDKRQNESQLELFERAKEFEKKGRLDEAATLYQNVIKKSPTKEHAYNRLMIIHRKKREYKKKKKSWMPVSKHLSNIIKRLPAYLRKKYRIPKQGFTESDRSGGLKRKVNL